MANPTTNYGFVLPTSSDLVTDLPADFEVALQGVDTRLKALQPGTTEGDLAYSSATADTNTRLALGTAGQVLTVNAGATAPEWATATASGANFTLLNAGGTALTGAATITVSGISGVDKLLVILDNASSANADSIIGVRLNTDTTSNYYTWGSVIEGRSTYSSIFLDAQGGVGNRIYVAKMSSNAASSVDGAVLLEGCNGAGLKVLTSTGSASPAGGSGHIAYNTGGYYNSASTISSVSAFSSTGNFDTGTIYVYGA